MPCIRESFVGECVGRKGTVHFCHISAICARTTKDFDLRLEGNRAERIRRLLRKASARRSVSPPSLFAQVERMPENYSTGGNSR